MTRLAVAAVMPVYNQRETVCEAIESVLAQTQRVDEIVVVDDGSTDGTGELAAGRFGRRGTLAAHPKPSAGMFAGPRDTLERALYPRP